MRSILKLVVRVVVDAIVLDRYHSVERGAVRRVRLWRARRADG